MAFLFLRERRYVSYEIFPTSRPKKRERFRQKKGLFSCQEREGYYITKEVLRDDAEASPDRYLR